MSKAGQFFLESRPWPEGSYKLGSVRPCVRASVLLSGQFLGIGSSDFLEIFYFGTDECEVVPEGARSSKNSYCLEKG